MRRTNIFQNRPLALFGTALAACAALAIRMNTRNKILFLAVCSAFLVGSVMLCCLWKKGRTWSRYVLAASLGMTVALCSSYLYFDCYVADRQDDVGKSCFVQGTVLERDYATSFSSIFYVELDTVDGEDCRERAVLECDYPSALQAGDRFRATVSQREFVKTTQYNEENGYLADGYTRILTCERSEHCTIQGQATFDLRVWLSNLNTKLSVLLCDALGEREGGLIAAILLGNRSFLTDETVLAFRCVGVSHLLALSGLHVSVLIGCLEFLMRKFRIGRMLRAWIIPTLLIAYLGLTGCSVSAMRAVLMVCFLYLGFLLRADYDGLTALCTVLALLLTLTPYAVYDLSMWFSFLAAASIIIFYPMIEALCVRVRGGSKRPAFWRRWLAGIVSTVLVSVVANAAILMLSTSAFGETSVMSIPATLLLTLPLSLLLILSLPLLPLIGISFLTYPCRFLSKLVLDLTEWMADLDGILLAIGSGYESILLFALTLLLVCLAVGRVRHASSLLLLPLLMAMLFGVSYFITNTSPRSYLASSAQTGGYEVLSEGGEMIAVDREATFAADAKTLSQLAKEMRCTEIDTLGIASYDDRAPYRIQSLSKQIRVRSILLSPTHNDREAAIAARIVEEAEWLGITVRYDSLHLPIPQAGDPFRWDTDPPIISP